VQKVISSSTKEKPLDDWFPLDGGTTWHHRALFWCNRGLLERRCQSLG
jgi:hypothetical protein